MMWLVIKHKIPPCQVLSKAEDKERVATIEASKVKEEESLEVAGERCWRKSFLQSLEITGELFTQLPCQVMLVAFSKCTFLLQRLGSSLSSSSLLCWPMLCLPLSSTTTMADVWTVNVVNVINVIYQCYQCFQCIIGVIDSKTIFLGDGIRIIEFSKWYILLSTVTVLRVLKYNWFLLTNFEHSARCWTSFSNSAFN